MAFNPPSLSFSYQPRSGNIPNETVILSTANNRIESVSSTHSPDWIDISNIGVSQNPESEGWEFKFIASVRSAAANNLAVGYHSGEIAVKLKVYAPWLVTFTYTMNVTIRVLENRTLTITPSLFQYNHLLGDPNPPTRFCTISTTSAWSIIPDQTWLTFTQLNGIGNASVGLNIDTSLLPVGISTANFLVDDGRTQRYGMATVNVTGNSTSDHLILNPSSLEFSETYGRPATDVRNFSISSSRPSTITVDVPWLLLSHTTRPAGFSPLTATAQNTSALAVGHYPGTIIVSNGEMTRQIFVLLIISERQFPSISNGKFYFAEDRNKISLNSSITNAEMLLNIKAQGGFGLKNYQREIPFYRNVLSVVVGLETSILLKPAPIPPLGTVFYTPIKPVRYDFFGQVRAMGRDSLVTPGVNIQDVHFINGKTPGSVGLESFGYNRLTYLPNKLTVPADAYIAFALRNPTPITQLKITKLITGTVWQQAPIIYPVPGNSETSSSFQLHAGILRVSELNLKPGDRFLMEFGSLQREIHIKPSELATTQILFENEWDCPEIFNCTGPASFEDEDGKTTAIYSRDGKSYERVLETKTPKSFTINTGNIYSDAEREYLSKILTAKRIWIQIGKTRVEVVHNIRGIEIFKTRDFTPDYTLKFKAAVV